jgi:hypothetical protein
MLRGACERITAFVGGGDGAPVAGAQGRRATA